MKRVLMLAAIGLLAALWSACAMTHVTRKYDATGILYENGASWGCFSDNAGKFTMTRHDQKGLNDVVEESAGAEVVSKSPSDATVELVRLLLPLIEKGAAAAAAGK